MQFCKIITMAREITLGIIMLFLAPEMTCAPLTSTDSSVTTAILNESTEGIVMEDYETIIAKTKFAHMHVTNALNYHCNWLNEEDFPPEYGKSRCLDYARAMGTTTATCTGNIPTIDIYNGSNIPIKQTTMEAVECMEAHRGLLDGVLQLPIFGFKENCTSVENNTSLTYCKCRMGPTKNQLKTAIKYAKYILADIQPPADSVPEEITCDVDESVESKAPLGILWKIQADLNAIIINVQQGCEKVKLDQENTSVSCA